MTHSSSEFPDTAFPAASRLQDLEQVLERERRRKLLLIVPVAGVIGTAVVFQATWALAVAATGMIGLQAWRRGH